MSGHERSSAEPLLNHSELTAPWKPIDREIVEELLAISSFLCEISPETSSPRRDNYVNLFVFWEGNEIIRPATCLGAPVLVRQRGGEKAPFMERAPHGKQPRTGHCPLDSSRLVCQVWMLPFWSNSLRFRHISIQFHQIGFRKKMKNHQIGFE